MAEARILHIEVSTPQAAMEAFANTRERAERGEPLQPAEAIGFESLAELLMDADTLLRHRDLWQREDKPAAGPLQRLTADELRPHA